MKIYNRIATLLLCSLACTALQAKDYVVTSPDGHLKATVSDNDRIQWTITHDGVTVLAPSAISIRTTPLSQCTMQPATTSLATTHIL